MYDQEDVLVRDGVRTQVEGPDADELLDYIDDIEDVSEIELRIPQKKEAKRTSLKQLFDQYLDERIQDAKKNGESHESTILTKMAPVRRGQEGQGRDRSEDVNKGNRAVRNKQNTLIKSPSDTMIYAPALSRDIDKGVVNMVNKVAYGLNKNSPFNTTPRQAGHIDMSRNSRIGGGEHSQGQLIDRISNFVETIRLDQERGQRQEQVVIDSPEAAIPGPSRISQVVVPGQDEAQARNDRTILEAEKFKAIIANPPGIESNRFPNISPGNNPGTGGQNLMFQGNVNQYSMHGNTLNPNPQIDSNVDFLPPQIGTGGVSDDDFFHLTCQVDESLKAKIEKGQYVDLDKLLPRGGPFDNKMTGTNGNPLQWVQKDGGTFLMPARKTTRISGFRK